MAAQQARQWGVTPAVSTALPTSKELAANDALIAELKRENNFENAEETERRTAVLRSLQNVTVEFVRQVSKRKGLPQSAVDSSGGKIFTYGSYRLGVYGPGSDIDTLVVVPRHVSRDEFFEFFPSLLESMAPPGAIEELTPVPDAFVPIIKMEYSGISIDLIFARLAIAQVPIDLELKDKSLLRGVEEKDLRCLNGTRVTDEILELVPQQKTFRHALRGIKLWAQRRAIYANVMGFPGGVAWAMLVARVCQLYPHATGSVIIGKFFRIMSKWAWPQPVLLKPIEDGPLQVRVWNPKVYNGDRFHLMPIITPAYPSMCATHNITMSTKKIIIRELDRAGDIADKILTGQLLWKELFARHTFFTHDYKYYLSIVAASRSKDAQLLWSGLVESKVRLLVASLETVDSIEVAHPFNKGYDRVHHCNNEDEVDKVLTGDLQFQEMSSHAKATDLANDPRHIAAAQAGGSGSEPLIENVNAERDDSEKHVIYTTTYYVGIELAEHAKKSLDISWQTKEFKDICTSWPQYNPDLNSLTIVHTRNYDLPDDIFITGEKRPVRIKKPKGTKSNGTLPKKRSFAASELEGPAQGDAKRQHSYVANPSAETT